MLPVSCYTQRRMIVQLPYSGISGKGVWYWFVLEMLWHCVVSSLSTCCLCRIYRYQSAISLTGDECLEDREN
jgi:hypothetical protein